jgi:peptidoglycan-N-acetylglucosamine deacetylase
MWYNIFMKKILKLAIIIVIIVVGVWFWQNKSPTDQLESVNQQNQADKKSSQVLASTSTISQSDSFYNIQVNYPQFSGIDAVFNQKITDLISEKIQTFKQDAKDYQQARKDTAGPGEVVGDNPEEPFDFVADWQSGQINDKYISFVLTIYYFSGGAHGNEEVYAFNYDVKNKKEITINDFLNSSEINLQKLSDLSVQKAIFYLKANVGSVDRSMQKWIEDGAGVKWENFKNFNFTADSLIIYFQKYQVAAGAVGPVTIVLPKSELNKENITSIYFQ